MSTEHTMCMIPMSMAITFWYFVFSGISLSTTISKNELLSRLYSFDSHILASSVGISSCGLIATHIPPRTALTGILHQYCAIGVRFFSIFKRSFLIDRGYFLSLLTFL